MDEKAFRLSLYLPAQGAAETEATIIEWCISEGDHFEKGQVLAQVDSAKSVFDFEAPSSGLVIRLLRLEGETVSYDEPVMEIETSDQSMKDWIPPAATATEVGFPHVIARPSDTQGQIAQAVSVLGLGSYLPKRVVTNAELVENFPEITADYVYQVTGIRERRWADEDEKPSDMAHAASLEAIRKAGIGTKDVDAIILATTTPDVAMPSTACILQDRLSLGTIPAFDLNAACSGWLYGVSMARGMIVSGMAKNVLTVGVDLQSRLLDRSDRATCFIFGDAAGAAIISAGEGGHRIREVILGADTRGLHMARRDEPGYVIANGYGNIDPWIRMDGQAMFRFATESFATIIHNAIAKTGWSPAETRWIIPHQANGRILKAAAKRSGIPFQRFYLNVERVGNTSSASIPLALIEVEDSLEPGDKLILCSVGAGVTTAAISIEW
ncbi:MAG TPA: beta-ketoacyl-ACP synthase 3 [Thermoguttaceae bacterium]|nr:beta-ketoacyl-ACP synthase 3 [Thermoguttaceae bacterium]